MWPLAVAADAHAAVNRDFCHGERLTASVPVPAPLCAACLAVRGVSRQDTTRATTDNVMVAGPRGSHCDGHHYCVRGGARRNAHVLIASTLHKAPLRATRLLGPIHRCPPACCCCCSSVSLLVALLKTSSDAPIINNVNKCPVGNGFLPDPEAVRLPVPVTG